MFAAPTNGSSPDISGRLLPPTQPSASRRGSDVFTPLLSLFPTGNLRRQSIGEHLASSMPTALSDGELGSTSTPILTQQWKNQQMTPPTAPPRGDGASLAASISPGQPLVQVLSLPSPSSRSPQHPQAQRPAALASSMTAQPYRVIPNPAPVPAGCTRVVKQRNKAVICRVFAMSGGAHCHLHNCPFRHVTLTSEEPLPRAVCKFSASSTSQSASTSEYPGPLTSWASGSCSSLGGVVPGATSGPAPAMRCLRDGCRFFHGSEEALMRLRASRAPTYRPAEYLPMEDPELTLPEAEAQLYLQQHNLALPPSLLVPAAPATVALSATMSSAGCTVTTGGRATPATMHPPPATATLSMSVPGTPAHFPHHKNMSGSTTSLPAGYVLALGSASPGSPSTNGVQREVQQQSSPHAFANGILFQQQQQQQHPQQQQLQAQSIPPFAFTSPLTTPPLSQAQPTLYQLSPSMQHAPQQHQYHPQQQQQQQAAVYMLAPSTTPGGVPQLVLVSAPQQQTHANLVPSMPMQLVLAPPQLQQQQQPQQQPQQAPQQYLPLQQHHQSTVVSPQQEQQRYQYLSVQQQPQQQQPQQQQQQPPILSLSQGVATHAALPPTVQLQWMPAATAQTTLPPSQQQQQQRQQPHLVLQPHP